MSDQIAAQVENGVRKSASNFRTVDVDHHVREIDEKGYTVIHDLMTDQFREEIAAVVQSTIDHEPRQPTNEFKGLKTIRIADLLLKDPLYHDLVLAPPIEAINTRVLGEESILSTLMTMALEPGAAAQPLHCDDIWACRGFPRPIPTVMLTVVWALSEFTEANGATHMVAGSHRSPTLPAADIADAVRADAVAPGKFARLSMGPGSVAIWTGSAWHHAGANRTNETRIGLTASYNAGWLRGYENFCFTVPAEIARGFPPRLQEMIGYGTYHKGMGTVNGGDPRDALFPGWNAA